MENAEKHMLIFITAESFLEWDKSKLLKGKNSF